MTQPFCRVCGTPIRKRTRRVWLRDKEHAAHGSDTGTSRYLYVPAFPKTKAECAKLTNWQVVSVSRTNYGGFDHIDSFSEWDGDSYVDPFFCTGEHARDFGYVMAREGHCLRPYNDAVHALSAEIGKVTHG